MTSFSHNEPFCAWRWQYRRLRRVAEKNLKCPTYSSEGATLFDYVVTSLPYISPKFREVWTCGFWDMRADRHADLNTSHPCLEVKSAIFTNSKKNRCTYWWHCWAAHLTAANCASGRILLFTVAFFEMKLMSFYQCFCVFVYVCLCFFDVMSISTVSFSEYRLLFCNFRF